MFGPKRRHLVDEDDQDVIVVSSEDSGDDKTDDPVLHVPDVPPPQVDNRYDIPSAPSASSRNFQTSLWDYVAYVSDSEPSRETYASTARSKPKGRSKLHAQLILTPQQHSNADMDVDTSFPPYVPQRADSENNSSSASNNPHGKGKKV